MPGPYTVKRSKHESLAATTVETVNFDSNPSDVEVTNWSTDPAVRIFFTTDGADPAVKGDNTFSVGAGSSLRVNLGYGDSVKLISNAVCEFSVVGL